MSVQAVVAQGTVNGHTVQIEALAVRPPAPKRKARAPVRRGPGNGGNPDSQRFFFPRRPQKPVQEGGETNKPRSITQTGTASRPDRPSSRPRAPSHPDSVDDSTTVSPSSASQPPLRPPATITTTTAGCLLLRLPPPTRARLQPESPRQPGPSTNLKAGVMLISELGSLFPPHPPSSASPIPNDHRPRNWHQPRPRPRLHHPPHSRLPSMIRAPIKGVNPALGTPSAESIPTKSPAPSDSPLGYMIPIRITISLVPRLADAATWLTHSCVVNNQADSVIVRDPTSTPPVAIPQCRGPTSPPRRRKVLGGPLGREYPNARPLNNGACDLALSWRLRPLFAPARAKAAILQKPAPPKPSRPLAEDLLAPGRPAPGRSGAPGPKVLWLCHPTAAPRPPDRHAPTPVHRKSI